MFRLFSRQQPDASAPVADEVRSLADPSDWLLDLFGAVPAQAGVSVTPATAMRPTAVRAAVEAITKVIGGLPPRVYQRGDNGAQDRAIDRPACGLLHGNGRSQGAAHG